MAKRTSTKFHWDTTELLKRYDEATKNALKWAGMDTRRSIQRQMRHRTPKTSPAFWVVREGKPERRVNSIRDDRGRFTKRKMGGGQARLVAAVYRVPDTDKVTTWRSPTHPKGALDRSIESDWDDRTKSVVVGAAKSQWLADLHNLGGEQTYSFIPTASVLQKKFRDARGSKDPKDTVYGFIVYGTPPNAIMTFSRELRGRDFMGIGYQAVRGKILKKFRDALHKTGSEVDLK